MKNYKKMLGKPARKFGIALQLLLIGCLAISGCRREKATVSGGLPGVSVENGTELLVALPIENAGKSDVHNVEVREIEVRGGHRDLPVTLPVNLGTIAVGGRKVIQIRFAVAGLDTSKIYELDLEGRYVGRGDDRDDPEKERTFKFETNLRIPPQGPGSATVTTNHGVTHRTQGPYAGLPQGPEREKNENLAPTTESAPHVVFPKTPQFSGIKDPGITTFPGIAKGGAAVGFVINTQAGGVATNFPPDASGAGSGGSSNVVLTTGNLYVKYSTDAGKTFNTDSNKAADRREGERDGWKQPESSMGKAERHCFEFLHGLDIFRRQFRISGTRDRLAGFSGCLDGERAFVHSDR